MKLPLIALTLCSCIASLPMSHAATWTVDEVELIQYNIPRNSVFRTAKGYSSTCPGIFVILNASTDGKATAEGIGDILPRKNVTNEPMEDAWPGAIQLTKLIEGLELKGDDLNADREKILRLMDDLKAAANAYPLTTDHPPSKDRQLRATLCGMDTALFALLGDIYDKPLHEVLGTAQRDRVGIAGVTKSLGVSAGEAQKAVFDAHAEHRCVRFKIGVNREEELAMLRASSLAINAHRPELEIFVDVNQGWKDAPTALEALAEIREMLLETGYTGRFICEQPTRESSFEDLAAVTKVTRQWAKQDPFQILIMADESLWDKKDLEELVALDAVDQVNIKIQKAGGLSESLRMAEYLHEAKPEWEVYIGGVLMTDVGAWANHQLGYTLPRLDYMTGAVPRRSNAVNPAVTPLRYSRNTRQLLTPSSPGLGTTLDREVLEPYIVETYSTKKHIQ